jgi:hypothetical protein
MGHQHENIAMLPEAVKRLKLVYAIELEVANTFYDKADLKPDECLLT